MKRLICCLIGFAVLVGCDGNGAPEPDAAGGEAAAPPVTAPVAKEPVPAPEGQKGIDALDAAGVEIAFPHAVNYDILDTSKNGTPRHRVLLEVLGGDFDAVVEQFTGGLTGIGYRQASSSVTDGRIEQVYVQDGKPTYYLLMQPVDRGPPLANPDATGSIHVMWNRD